MRDPLSTAIGNTIAQVEGLKAELMRLHSLLRFATKMDVDEAKDQIMSAISDFKARQDAFNDRLDAAIDGVTADVQALKALVEKLQSTAGQITPEDQALLDQLEARIGTAVTKVEALDALTENPPVPPTQ